MDKSRQPPHDEDRFNEITGNLLLTSRKVEYNPKTVPFVPISGWYGDNMLKKNKKISWFKTCKTEREEETLCLAHLM